MFHDELNYLGKFYPDLSSTLGDELLRPTKIYVKPLLETIKQFGGDIKGISHITGGGHYENIPRMLPEGIRARIEVSKFPQMPIFKMLAHKGSIPERDMYNTYNMGIGLVMAVSEDKADDIMSALRDHGETPIHIGYCTNSDIGVDILW